ncbi:PadR family transcriptional regulator [Actinoplanes sp. NPDC049118]|uniref:PadR family transcriptional regulator n=1 Tax=Actinoplanes sp. NPDC049118 TaxID=3155769 RepID=UPI00340B8B48
MPRDPNTSPQTLAVLRSLLADVRQFRYGYDLAKELGLKSGTLYPILARLAEQGHLERHWETDAPSGRPPRQMYRLTPAGQEFAARVEAARRKSPTARRAVSPRWEGAA